MMRTKANKASLLPLYRIVAYLLKSRYMEPEKQPLLGNGCVTCNNGIIVGTDIFCVVHYKAIFHPYMSSRRSA
jgi:hypothetical protein